MLDFLRGETRRIANTIVWSVAGWRAAWASEKSLRQWTLFNLVSAGLALALPLSPAERAAIIGLGLVVLAAELLNTAIEEIMDHVTPHEHPQARKAKDCGSAAVALAVIATLAAWAVVLWGMWGG
jgi:diacylglycerol kinase (ATP)